MRLETYKMATSILLKFQTLECDISRTIWRIEVSDGSLFCIFHALSLEHNLFFDRTCPLVLKVSLIDKQLGLPDYIHTYHIKTCQIIDISIPLDTNVELRHSTRWDNYMPLVDQLR